MPNYSMRRFALLAAMTCVLLTALDVAAAKMVVRDMKLVPTDQSAINPETMKKDQNGKTAAIIKIYTPNIKAEETFFDNGMMGIPGRINKPGEIWLYIPARSQNLTVSNPRFEPLTWWFSEEIKPGKVYTAILTVEGKEVTLSASVRQAPLFVDNEPVGDSPQNVYLSYGEHYIVANREPMFGEKTILVTPESPTRIEIQMEDQNLKFSDVTVTSPDGAEIWFEGKRAALGVFKTRLETGDYTAEFRKPNHENALLQFHATAGQPTEVTGPKLLPYRGMLNVTVNPTTGTRILSGDTLVAEHRLEKQLEIGRHTYIFEKKGYHPLTKTFTVSRNEETVDTVTLERIQYIRKNSIYAGIGAVYGLNLGAGIHVGANFSNINVEVDYSLGLTKGEDVYWFQENPELYVGRCSYTVDAIGLKAGYQLSFVQRIGLTPQIGYLGQKLRGGDRGNGAMCHNVSIGARLVFNPFPSFGIFVNPEYAIPVQVNDLYEEIHKYGGPGKGGFQARAGIEFNFGF